MSAPSRRNAPKPFSLAAGVTLFLGDCIPIMRRLPAESFDAVVTDPPYGIAFMAKGWDRFERRAYESFSAKWAAEARQVVKPGGYLIACGSPRTYHRLAAGIEDAGFEIRDSLAWIYGEGFPKSINLEGGLGTGLKPAIEPIVLARRPFAGTVAENVARYGTGALNIDAARIDFAGAADKAGWIRPTTPNGSALSWKNSSAVIMQRDAAGRWPSNVILGCACEGDHAETCASREAVEAGQIRRSGTRPLGDGFRFEAETLAERPPEPAPCDCGWRHDPACAVAILDAQSGDLGRSAGYEHGRFSGWEKIATGEITPIGYGDTGGASRFFYVAKADAAERNFGLEHMAKRTPAEITGRKPGSAGLDNPRAGTRSGARQNHHPTVKPVALMRYLIRLVTPAGGHVLDPFLGSGTTKVAAIMERRTFTGIEIDPEYLAIAEARAAQAGLL